LRQSSTWKPKRFYGVDDKTLDLFSFLARRTNNYLVKRSQTNDLIPTLTRSARKGRDVLETLGRYSVLEDRSETHAQPAERAWRTWLKAFNRDLRCYVALEVIPKAGFPSAQARQQFQDEVLTATGVHHRNVAAIFPLQVVNESYLYAMEFCNGETVAAQVARSGCLETFEALDIAKQIAAGLEVASSAGLVHRNISPGNVMVLEEDGEISVKVLGLALPAGRTVASLCPTSQEADFTAPEENAGKDIDIRSGIYSLGALLYFMEAGFEKYKEFRARLKENKARNLFENAEGLSHRVTMVARQTICQEPNKRIATFGELIDAIDQARTAPEPPPVQPVVTVLETDDAAKAKTIPQPEISSPPEVIEATLPTKIAPKSFEPAPGELMIPPELLNVAQPGRALRLNRVGVESPEQIAVYVGSSFRIGRLRHLELVTRFLPRNKANDTKSKRLSKIHVTAKCEEKQILLFDGDGRRKEVSGSANGSTFQSKVLSPTSPLPLVESGELQLARVYSIKVIPLLRETNEVPAIVNLNDWTGPIAESASSLNGVIVFIPNERSEVDVTLWLFSAATFRVSGSSLDFTLPAAGPTFGALRYFGGCFWIEQKSTAALLVNDLRLAIGEIAPLTTGQTVEVNGIKYAVHIEDIEPLTRRLTVQ
jgi:serine/threonine protein kinase